MRRPSWAVFALAALVVAGCATSRPKPGTAETMRGKASWYGQEFAGRTTANGEIFDPMLLTAAHRTLPFGTIVDVRYPQTDRTVRVRINDRGPFIGDRVIDLSYGAARAIGMVEAGVASVEMRIISIGAGEREAPRPLVVEATPPAPLDPDQPPPVAFPLPPSAAASPGEATVEVDRIEVVEEREEAVVRKQVSDDGRSIVTTPVPPAAPAPAAAATKPPSGPAKRVAAGRWALQAGAFHSRANAEQLRGRIAAVADEVFIEQAGEFFRVRVGPFSTREKAIDARELLEANGFPAMVVTVQ